MASAWADAYIIDQLPLSNKYIYLMQDFEPIFYPNGDEKIRADSTYRSNKYIAICNTKLLYDHIKSQDYKEFNNAPSTWFEPAVALKARGDPRRTGNSKKVLFIYGRPRVKRNLFLAAIEAVNIATQSDEFDPSKWDIYIAGEDGVPDVQLDSGVRISNLGKMPLDDYYKFVLSVDLAVSPMMAPHPNYPTLEFASVGAKVITTSFGAKQTLSQYSENIIVVDPSVGAISKVLREQLIGFQKNKTSKTDTPIKLISDNWEASLKKPIEYIVKNLK